MARVAAIPRIILAITTVIIWTVIYSPLPLDPRTRWLVFVGGIKVIEIPLATTLNTNLTLDGWGNFGRF